VADQPMLSGPDADLFRVQVNNARWYCDPLPACDIAPATDERWPAVSTVKKAWSKPFRKKLPTGETVPLDAFRAAEFAVDKLAAIKALADDRAAAITLIATSAGRFLNAAANRGTGVHTVLEELGIGHQIDQLLVDDAVRPFVAACRAFVADWQPSWVAAEFIAINRTLGYAGTADAVVTIERDGKPWTALVDWKTRGGAHGAYEEEIAQIGGYSLAEYIVVRSPDGTPVRMLPPGLDGGLIVSITKDGYLPYPIDLEEAQAAFRAMHTSWREHRDGQKAARRGRQNPLIAVQKIGVGARAMQQAGAAAETFAADRSKVEPPDDGFRPGCTCGLIGPSAAVDDEHLDHCALRKPEIRQVDIVLHGKDDETITDYRAGVWSAGDREIFGLTYGGSETHMCYGLDYFKPPEVLAERQHEGHERFYFDAGGNGRPVYADRDELERAFKALGLIDDASAPGLEARVDWMRARIAALTPAAKIEAGRMWPDDTPRKAEHIVDHDQIDRISKCLWQVETAHGLSFPDPDPADDTPTPAPEPDKPLTAKPADDAVDWANKGKALLALLDDEPLAHACAVVAGCHNTRMTQLRYQALQAVVTQVGSPGGAIRAEWHGPNPDITVVAQAEQIMALGAAQATGAPTATKRIGLTAARNAAHTHGLPVPKSLGEAATSPLLAALTASGTNTHNPQET
jgi:hypothetical protein